MAHSTLITDVHVFDGDDVSAAAQDVLFDDTGIISVEPAGSTQEGSVTIAGSGRTLLPGLIDAHIHIEDESTLHELARHGVTTAIDMSAGPPEALRRWRDYAASNTVADLRSPGYLGCGPGGYHARFIPADNIIETAADAARFVNARLEQDADFIKVVLEPPGGGGPSEDAVREVVRRAHEAGKRVVAHAMGVATYRLAADLRVDFITHTAADGELDDQTVDDLHGAGVIVIPTLVTHEVIVVNGLGDELGSQRYANVQRNAERFLRADIPLLAGTDANATVGSPASIPHGPSLYRELELLVQAGMTPIEALRAGTSRIADTFDLGDRGRIRPGVRADLLLVQGDPTDTITSVRAVEKVFIKGREYLQSRSA